jgi:hypothetical protein
MKEEIEKLSAKERKIVLNNLETIGTNLAVRMGGKVKQKMGEHLGYTCDLVTAMGTTSCQISGTPIMLKTESDMMGIKIKTVAKKVDKNASIPDTVFQVPGNVNVTFSKEADDMNRAMIASMIDSMKDPDAAKKFKEGMTHGKMQMEEQQRMEAQERHEQAMRKQKQDVDTGDAVRDDNGEPDEKELNEMMQKGMDTLKGLFK